MHLAYMLRIHDSMCVAGMLASVLAHMPAYMIAYMLAEVSKEATYWRSLGELPGID
jgi:hypothetical protein